MNKQTDRTNTTTTGKADGIKAKIEAKLPGAKKTPQSMRITNANIEEHRENILARGRKLKYPVQYSKKRLIIISIVVVVAAIGIFSFWLNQSLYKRQQTGDFFYSVTKVLPLNVAKVDGEPVRYSDYLRRLRADVYYYLNREHRSFNSEEGAKELDYLKRRELNATEKAAYVRKLAEQNNVTVDDATVDEQIKSMREANNETEEGLISTLQTYYGWTMNDYRATLRDQILEQEVSYVIDDEAKAEIEQAESRLAKGEDFAAVVAEMSDDESSKSNGGVVVAKTTDDDPTGIVDAVSNLSVGELSDIGRARIDNANYYYIARLDKKDGESITYSIIMVRLNKLDDDFAQLREQGKIKEYISVPDDVVSSETAN